MSINHVESNVSQTGTQSVRLPSEKSSNSSQTEKSVSSPKEDNAVKISISEEGMNSFRKNFHGNSKNANKADIIRQAKQATSALTANNYVNELSAEIKKIKDSRLSSSSHSCHHQEKDYVKAYKKLCDEIVQDYQKGTRERYVEDKTSETGYRKMTMKEELDGLEQAFHRIKDRAKTREMISGKLKRLRRHGKN